MTEIISRRSATWIAWKAGAKYRARRTLEAVLTLIKIALFVGLCSSAGVLGGLGALYVYAWLAE